MSRKTRYASYADAGPSWMGSIPIDWSVVRLGSVFRQRTEKVSDTEYPPLSVTKNGIVPQLDSAAKSDDGENRKRIEPGDFVINSRSDRKGSSGISDLRGSTSLINIVLTPNKKFIDPGFCHHLLRSVPFQEEFYRYGKGIVADLWSTRFSDMKGILLALPSVTDQEEIASFLDRETSRIDRLIDRKTRFMELLKEKREALLSNAVTKGISLKCEMKPSGVDWLGQVPSSWSVPRLKDLVDVKGGSTPSKNKPHFWSGQIPWVSPKDMKKTYIDDSIDHVSEAAITETSLRLIPVDAVLMVVRGMILAHSLPVALTTAPVTINQDMKALRAKNSILPHYLLRLMQGIKDVAFQHVDDSAHGTKKIEWDLLGSMLVPVPPKEEQEMILAHLDSELRLIQLLCDKTNRSIALLKERRSALITAAVTGKIDVRNLSELDTEASLETEVV